MRYLRALGFLGLAVMLALVTGAVSTERAFAQTAAAAVKTITEADLTATTGDTPKSAQDKVNEKIAANDVGGGTVVMFPSGTFRDVGEIQVFGKSGTAPSGSGATAVAAKPITLRGDGTVFTGKIMINVQGSKYIVIEGFTFRDTDVPDAVTFAPGAAAAGGVDTTAARGEDTGVVWLNTAVVAASAVCGSVKPVDNVTVRNNVFMNTARTGILARTKYDPSISAFSNVDPGYELCDSSAVTVSGNRFVGIGLGPSAVYLDSARTLAGYRNRESAIEGEKTYGWTVTGNVVGVTADGTEVPGTTANGIRLDNAFGETVVRGNRINNTAWSGIVVGGDGSRGSTPSDPAAEDAEITIANNGVANSRNDPYLVSRWMTSGEGYVHRNWRFGLGSTAIYPAIQSQALDGLLKARIYGLPDGFALPHLGAGDPPSRLVTSIIRTGYHPDTGARPAGVADKNDAADNRIPNEATVRYLRTGLEAGVELNRITGTATVENNELTGNVVGLVVCPSWYCYADHPFQPVLSAEVPEAGTLKVPTVRNNRIYDNDKETDMPGSFVRADVVNALAETNTGESKNVLVLAGNYLGDSPEVYGAVNTDGLASDPPENAGPPETAGPKETNPPGLDADAAGRGVALSGTTITLTYDEALDGTSVPAAAAFTVTQTDGSGLAAPISVTGVAVSGMSVRLTLAGAPGSGNSVTVSYDPAKAARGTGRGPIKDIAGNEAPALTSRTATASTPTPEEPMRPEAATNDGGCALASDGSGGSDLGALLPLMLVIFVFGLGRDARKNI